ncbi:MAG TPA: hypothetical protein VF228_24310 [Iamia sp.]
MAWRRRTPETSERWRSALVVFVAVGLSLGLRRALLDEDVGFLVDLGVAFLIMMVVLTIAFATGFLRFRWERVPD